MNRAEQTSNDRVRQHQTIVCLPPPPGRRASGTDPSAYLQHRDRSALWLITGAH